MMRVVAVFAVLWSLVCSPAMALTVPNPDYYYFTGTTDELYKIRAAVAKAAGYPEESWTYPYSGGQLFYPPWGMGAVDCMFSYYAPNQGPYDGAEDYLGMSVELHGEIVEIPALEDLVNNATMPGQCYGYLFHEQCGDSFWGPILCADPVP